MLSEEKIESNKQEFLALINSITRESDKERFLSWLEDSDFFIAPASTQYHLNVPGGLCQHSLNVYYALVKLVDGFATTTTCSTCSTNEEGVVSVDNAPHYDSDTLKLVALLHDIAKTNFYETFSRNVKNEDTGKWESVLGYRKRDDDNRFIYGSHEQNSEYMAETFFPLTIEERIAILHHHGGLGYDSVKEIIPSIYNKYKLALLLHLADMIATYDLDRDE